MTFLALPGDAGGPRVAYAVGKRVGGAVVRNRLRRRLRAAISDVGHSLPPGAYLVAAANDATELSFEELKEHVTAVMTSATRGRTP